MPRKPREMALGEYYHVLSRGNNKQTLFHEAGDYEYYLRALGHYRLKYGVSIFHYCLMTNHVHLLLRSDQKSEGITKMMHGLQMVYAFYFKRRRDATGHVFEDRFRHILIDSEAYLLECGRYIERNPLRARMVRGPGDYRWSSYSFYAFGKADEIVTSDPLYETLGLAKEDRQKSYREYVEPPRPYEIILDRYFEERVLV